jgi:hypothetical protein
MPMPVSRTRTSTRSGVRSHETEIRPPGGVNLVALVRRLSRICWRRSGSACATADRSQMLSNASSAWFRRRRISASARSIAAGTVTAFARTSTRPESSCANDRMSSTSRPTSRDACLIASALSRCGSVSSP